MKRTRRYLFFTLLLLITGFSARASHIVGGEFELVHLQHFSYRLSLILYSDDINITDPAAIDAQASVHIYRKRDNVLIRTYVLPKYSQEQVPYTNPDCAIPELSTSKVVYRAEVMLEEDEFNDPQGYYLSYERCCRNGVIRNIVDPGAVGQAFYLEFPPVVDAEGNPFVNSAPNLFPPLSDFARLGYPFYFDFSGTDKDGDSLVYSLAAPLAGYSSPDPGFVLPPPSPAPYPEVQWAAGFSADNMIPGSPGLQISQDGLIRITPTEEGIFVFSLKVEEYRDKKKIGEVRRDFQMLVYNYEGSDYPPRLQASHPLSGTRTEGPLRLTDADFPALAEDEQRCFQLFITDEDMGRGAYNERLNFRVRPLNFSGSFNGSLSATTGYVNPDKPEFRLDVCLPLCPPRSGAYLFDVIAYDDACAVPLSDTLRVEVDFQSQANQLPQTYSSLNGGASAQVFARLGDFISFAVEGRDADADQLSLRMEGRGFDPALLGMEFEPLQGSSPLQGTFRWTPTCENVNLTEQSVLELDFITLEETDCPQPIADTLRISLHLSPAANQAPQLSLEGQEIRESEVFAGNTLSVPVLARDADAKDRLSLRLVDISPADSLLSYTWQDVQGENSLRSELLLAPDCRLLSPQDSVASFRFRFAVSDDACFNSKSDTLELQLKVRDRVQDFERVRYTNVFTPNGDSFNPYFQIENLPPDRCDNRFEEVIIFNRWGRPLFRSSERNFRWDGEDVPSGTYYYVLRYTQMEYRSPLSLLRGAALAD